MQKQRVGFYCWAGPGTIRMINLKFFNPPIDKESLMGSYEYGYLAKAQELFKITDFWATYSWGFSDETEKVDREFLISRVENFKKLGIRLHAYIQGPNLVYSEFPNKDWWARDEWGRAIPYYRGRRVVCINNKEFQELILKRIETLKKSQVDGLFVDNIQMGQLGVSYKDRPINFCGCNCKICQKLFGKNITESKEYLDFRTECLNKFVKLLSNEAKSLKLEFGVNSYDPRANTKITTGLDLNELSKVADYILFENSHFPGKENPYPNNYIHELTYSLKRPIFLVSYKKGIGFDSEFDSSDFSYLANEDVHSRFHSCIKGSEFVTNGVWHNLRLDEISVQKIQPSPKASVTRYIHKDSVLKYWWMRELVRLLYNPLMRLYFENKVGRYLLSGLAKKAYALNI